MSSIPFSEQAPLQHADLRELGIKYLQELVGQTWTDHNLHDPGITILEQVCYALTDLSYRLHYTMPDILARADEASPYGSLFSPAKIMSTQAVTLEDMRKLVLDVPGVRNARIEKMNGSQAQPVYFDAVEHSLGLQQALRTHAITRPIAIKGLYQVFILPEDGVDQQELRQQVWKQLLAHRNLCEDIEAVRILEQEPVQLQVEIELDQEINIHGLVARLQQKLEQYISPQIPFYTLSERLASGQAMDEIFKGPWLQHGFIDGDELLRFTSPKSLRTSDMIRLIMEEEGISAVRKFCMRTATGPEEDWFLALQEKDAAFSFDRENTRFFFFKDGLAIPFIPLVSNLITRLETSIKRKKILPIADRDLHLKPGRYRSIKRYLSIQRHFPDLYGIGEAGLPLNASPERKAQAKQLKAYLAFFDQILANYFAQWEEVKNLFSIQQSPGSTYFTQPLYGPEGISKYEEIRPKAPMAAPAAAIDDDRNNRLLNHLLARFGEDFSDYALMQFAGQAHQEQSHSKQQFLKDYPRLSANRAGAIDYSEKIKLLEGTINPAMPVFQQRLYRKLDFPIEDWGQLTGLARDHPGGFHVLEHLLLRPNPGDEHQQSPLMVLPANASFDRPPLRDPYSLQMSFIFPDWLSRLGEGKEAFRAHVIKVIREETPVHLSLHFHWLNQTQMETFEKSYFHWLDQLQKRFADESTIQAQTNSSRTSF